MEFFLEYENVNPTDEQRAALRAMGNPRLAAWWKCWIGGILC
jgi:hypothetical protein